MTLGTRPDPSPDWTQAFVEPIARPFMGGAPPVVELDQVSRRFNIGGGEVVALADVDFSAAAGEFVVILGPSGSGKTTLLNLIGALDRPSSGRVVIAGHDVTELSNRELFEVRRHSISFIFQTFNLFPGLTALENVQFGIDVARGRHSGASAAAMLAEVGLGDRGDHFPSELSGGEQQRVAIARALATENPVLLADEPTGELDVTTGVRILELLRAQADQHGRAVLVVTHNRAIGGIADRVVELSAGRVVSDAPPAGPRVQASDLTW